MARSVAYPEFIEPLVHFVEDTAPEHIVARTHDKLAAGAPVQEMLLASALAVERSSDLPPGHHGGPLHPLAGLHAFKHHQATYEEFYSTRRSLRWRHLVAAVQASAISHGRIQDVFDHAAEVMHF